MATFHWLVRCYRPGHYEGECESRARTWEEVSDNCHSQEKFKINIEESWTQLDIVPDRENHSESIGEELEKSETVQGNEKEMPKMAEDKMATIEETELNTNEKTDQTPLEILEE